MHPKSNAYLAGILDGEGCISITSYVRTFYSASGKPYQCITDLCQISIFQTDERLMKWLVFHYGGKYYQRKPPKKYPNAKIGWHWQPARGKKQELLLLSIIPYLLLKKEQAILALEYTRLGLIKRGPGVDNELHTKRKALADRCSRLNQRKSSEANTSSTSPEVKIESGLIGDDENAVAVTQTV